MNDYRKYVLSAMNSYKKAEVDQEPPLLQKPEEESKDDFLAKGDSKESLKDAIVRSILDKIVQQSLTPQQPAPPQGGDPNDPAAQGDPNAQPQEEQGEAQPQEEGNEGDPDTDQATADLIKKHSGASDSSEEQEQPEEEQSEETGDAPSASNMVVANSVRSIKAGGLSLDSEVSEDNLHDILNSITKSVQKLPDDEEETEDDEKEKDSDDKEEKGKKKKKDKSNAHDVVHNLLDTIKSIVASEVKIAMDFPTKDALDTYLKEHPEADKSLHQVKETKENPAKKDDPKENSVKKDDPTKSKKNKIIHSAPFKPKGEPNSTHHELAKGVLNIHKGHIGKALQSLTGQYNNHINGGGDEYSEIANNISHAYNIIKNTIPTGNKNEPPKPSGEPTEEDKDTAFLILKKNNGDTDKALKQLTDLHQKNPAQKEWSKYYHILKDNSEKETSPAPVQPPKAPTVQEKPPTPSSKPPEAPPVVQPSESNSIEEGLQGKTTDKHRKMYEYMKEIYGDKLEERVKAQFEIANAGTDNNAKGAANNLKHVYKLVKHNNPTPVKELTNAPKNDVKKLPIKENGEAELGELVEPTKGKTPVDDPKAHINNAYDALHKLEPEKRKEIEDKHLNEAKDADDLDNRIVEWHKTHTKETQGSPEQKTNSADSMGVPLPYGKQSLKHAQKAQSILNKHGDKALEAVAGYYQNYNNKTFGDTPEEQNAQKQNEKTKNEIAHVFDIVKKQVMKPVTESAPVNDDSGKKIELPEDKVEQPEEPQEPEQKEEVEKQPENSYQHNPDDYATKKVDKFHDDMEFTDITNGNKYKYKDLPDNVKMDLDSLNTSNGIPHHKNLLPKVQYNDNDEEGDDLQLEKILDKPQETEKYPSPGPIDNSESSSSGEDTVHEGYTKEDIDRIINKKHKPSVLKNSFKHLADMFKKNTPPEGLKKFLETKPTVKDLIHQVTEWYNNTKKIKASLNEDMIISKVMVNTHNLMSNKIAENYLKAFKDKDIMNDTGGKSKHKVTPTLKPPRNDLEKRYEKLEDKDLEIKGT